MKRCDTLVHVTNGLGAITTVLNTLLLLVRVVAVFSHSKGAQSLFVAIWVLTDLSVLLTVPTSLHAVSVRPKGFCVMGRTGKYSAAAPLTTYVFSAIVFVSISQYVTSIRCPEKGIWSTLFFPARDGTVFQTLTENTMLYFL